MFGFEIITDTNIKYNIETIKKIFGYIDSLDLKKQNGVLNIVFVSEEEIQELNKNYRNIDKPTDVLSFGYFTDFSNLKSDEIAGEMIFCEEKIKSQAIEYSLGEEKEFYKLLIHSILHILGYDHEEDSDYKIMQELEDKVWEQIFN